MSRILFHPVFQSGSDAASDCHDDGRFVNVCVAIAPMTAKWCQGIGPRCEPESQSGSILGMTPSASLSTIKGALAPRQNATNGLSAPIIIGTVPAKKGTTIRVQK
jgi:hypothetical protein